MAKKKSTQSPIAITCNRDEWREGHRRAIAMFRDLRSISGDELDCQDDCRDGRPQENVVYGHLLGLISTRSDDVLAAFASVLTHYLGNCEHGGVPDIEIGEGPSPIVTEMRDPIRMQVGRPSRATISMKPFAEVANG